MVLPVLLQYRYSFKWQKMAGAGAKILDRVEPESTEWLRNTDRN